MSTVPPLLVDVLPVPLLELLQAAAARATAAKPAIAVVRLMVFLSLNSGRGASSWPPPKPGPCGSLWGIRAVMAWVRDEGASLPASLLKPQPSAAPTGWWAPDTSGPVLLRCGGAPDKPH
jgi:hypothetical protein